MVFNMKQMVCTSLASTSMIDDSNLEIHVSIHINIYCIIQSTSINTHQYIYIYICYWNILKLKLWFSSLRLPTSPGEAPDLCRYARAMAPESEMSCGCRLWIVHGYFFLSQLLVYTIHYTEFMEIIYHTMPIFMEIFQYIPSILGYYQPRSRFMRSCWHKPRWKSSQQVAMSAKETPTSIFWAEPREKQVLLRYLGFAGKKQNTLWHQKMSQMIHVWNIY